MNYRSILQSHLRRRQEVNSKYSLRAFAMKLDIAPSKLSEIIAGKKHLSFERAELIVDKLGLVGKEKEFFLASVRLESPREKTGKSELKNQLRVLSEQFNAGKTSQRNAWYFGAINAFEEEKIEASKYKEQMGLTDLQIENVKRFKNRIKRFYPGRSEISIEPVSILKKLEEEIYSESSSIECEFLFLTQKQTEDLNTKIKSLIRATKSKSKTVSPDQLNMVYWGFSKVLKK